MPQSIYLLTSLQNFKSMIDKDNDELTRDNIINRLITAATHEIEAYTKRKLRGRTYGANGLPAEYYNGSGTPRLYVNQYPIISVTSLHDDTSQDKAFGATYLKASTDYIIWKDEGIIELYPYAAKGSNFEENVGNIKLIYTAGYEEFQVIEDTNDRIDFIESDGGSTITANLTAGIYTAATLSAHIKTQMDDAGSQTYTVAYNYITSKFTIVTAHTFLTLEWTGDNAYRTTALLLGFRVGANDSGETTYTSDDSVLGIPADLEQATLEVAMRMWKQSKFGGGRFDKESEQMSGEQGGTLKFNTDLIPPHVKTILDYYRRMSI